MADKRIGERLRALRNSRGWTQEQVTHAMWEAGAPGWRSTATLSRIELGERSLPLEEAAVLASIFETSLDHLAGRDEWGPPHEAAIERLRTLIHQQNTYPEPLPAHIQDGD